MMCKVQKVCCGDGAFLHEGLNAAAINHIKNGGKELSGRVTMDDSYFSMEPVPM